MMPTTREASTPSRRAMRKAESKDSPVVIHLQLQSKSTLCTDFRQPDQSSPLSPRRHGRIDGPVHSIMILVRIRQAASLLLAILLSCAQSSAQTQASPRETTANEAQLQMTPHPNPKYAKKLAALGDKELADGRF